MGLRRELWFALLVLCSVASRVEAQSVTFAWDPSVGATGYLLRWGTSQGVYTSSRDAGAATTATVTGLTPGAQYWAIVEAYDAQGAHSAPSNTLPFVAPLNCSYSLSTNSIAVSAVATSTSVGVTAPTGCPWTPTANSPFIGFTGTSWSGTGTLTMSLVQNYTTAQRASTATVGGRTVTITQSAAAFDAAFHAAEWARADFNSDGDVDLLWQNTETGYLAAWWLHGTHTGWTPLGFDLRLADPNWRIVGTGDFNLDGSPDIVWRHSERGDLYLWFMNGTTRIGHSGFSFPGEPDIRWKIVGVGDFNGDTKPDLVWQHDTGWLTVYMMDGTNLMRSSDVAPAKVLDPNWRIVGVADLNADHNSDLIFQHMASGELAGWIMNGTTRSEFRPFSPSGIVDRGWQLAAVLDVNGDQSADLVWQHATNGGIAIWYMNGTLRSSAAAFPWTAGPGWKIFGPK